MFASLQDFGWNAWFQSHAHRLLPHHVPARVAAEHRGGFALVTSEGEIDARLGGRLRHEALDRLDLPAVGDWVGARIPPQGEAVVDLVLPRAGRLVRQSAGRRTEPQVVAANVDLVVLVTALDQDLNVRRLERWARVVETSGALPLVLLNKADLCEDPSRGVHAAQAALPGARVVVASASRGDGLVPLREALRPGITAALVGSSGVGKSTTLNALLGREVQATREVRGHDHRGRHATTHRELFLLPGGGLIIDTPGLRELAAWAEDAEPSPVFADVESRAQDCRFRDCGHGGEPGCAVRSAIDAGVLDPSRLQAARKLQRELAFQARRQDQVAQKAERQRWKAITRSMRDHPKAGR